MHCRALMSSMFVCLVLMGAGISAQMLGTDHANFAASGERSNLQTSPGGAQTTQPIRNPAELADRIFKREKAQVETIENSAPIVETYIQEEKSDALMGTIPKNDFYFLGQADFRGKTMKVHSMTARAHKGSIMWSYEPAGFLQMAFLDLRDFDKEHYRLRAGQRVFLGEVRCLFLMWTARRKLKDHDFKAESGSKIRTSPSFASTGPTRRRNFSLKHFDDEFYEHFDSWRTNIKSGLWIPSDIYIQDLREPPPTGGPRFKARTHL